MASETTLQLSHPDIVTQVEFGMDAQGISHSVGVLKTLITFYSLDVD